jgi:NAD(P)H:quinone oxidoreductase type IV
VLYYSSYGHTEKMAIAAAEGARAAGADVSLKRVPELVPHDVAKSSYFKMEQEGDIADPMELANYDGIIFATPTRFGMMAAQMKNFLDMTGGLWFSGALEGRVGTVMVSTASQHGGAEATILSFHTVLLHHGMVITGLTAMARKTVRKRSRAVRPMGHPQSPIPMVRANLPRSNLMVRPIRRPMPPVLLPRWPPPADQGSNDGCRHAVTCGLASARCVAVTDVGSVSTAVQKPPETPLSAPERSWVQARYR